MKVAVVGAGTAGMSSALLLCRDGHDVTVFDRVADPRPIGAGILLQSLGQRILDDLGLRDELAACSRRVRHIDGRTRGGSTVLRFGYEDAPGAIAGLGVHRGDLFRILWQAAERAGIPIETASPIDDVRHAADGWHLIRPAGDERGPFALVVAADGHRSQIRRRLGLAKRDREYPFGAIWTVVPDPDQLSADVLWQRYGGTRITLGILPTGLDQASIFWSVPVRDLDRTLADGVAAWLARARPYAGHLGALVERVTDAGLLGVRYRDVVVRRPYVTQGDHGIVLVGDAAHAMSPQLGMGASLALADAWSLATCVQAQPDRLGPAAEAYARDRRAHVAWYTWLSRLMTPVFQSDLLPLGWARDMAFRPAARVPWIRRQFATILRGEQTSPWTSWGPTRRGGPLAERRE